MQHPKPTDTNAPTRFTGTLHPADDFDEPILRAASARPKPEQLGPVPGDTEPFRPRQRPPIPLLQILDDNQQSAESIRIRKSPFRIGRQEGDVTISVDNQMSAAHAEIYLKRDRGQSIWHLKDLASSNGTFVRVSQMALRPGQLIMLGVRRFRIDVETGDFASQFTSDHTQAWSPVTPPVAGSHTYFVDVDAGPDGKRYPLSGSEVRVGRDGQQCSIVLDDPRVSPYHARIVQDGRGRWQLENRHSLNGVWAQIDEIALDKGAVFQCGEQRFVFKLP